MAAWISVIIGKNEKVNIIGIILGTVTKLSYMEQLRKIKEPQSKQRFNLRTFPV